MKNVLFGLFLIMMIGCASAPVARGTDKPWKRTIMEKYGYAEFGEWNYTKLKLTGENKLYAVKLEKDGDQLVAHCMETVYEYHKASYGPFDETVPFQKCTNTWLLSALKSIED